MRYSKPRAAIVLTILVEAGSAREADLDPDVRASATPGLAAVAKMPSQ